MRPSHPFPSSDARRQPILTGAIRSAVAFALAALTLLAGGGACGPARAAGQNKVAYARFDWHVYHSIHFDIYYYPEEEEFLDAMISYSESAYQKISKALDHEIVTPESKSPRIPLVYYKTHGEFEETNIELGEIGESTGAFSEPFQDRIVIPIDQPPDRVYAVLAHELTHIFEFSILYGDSLRRVLRSNPPAWIMEGLASYLGEDEDNIDRMVIRDAVVNNVLPPIEVLQDPQFLTYRYGHAIFDYINQDFGAAGIRNFLWEYRKVLLTNNVPKAIKEAFGIEVEEFNRRFNKYLRKKYFPVLMEKNEPGDNGTEIGLKKPGQYTFSPTLSPSGELVAALATPRDELDVIVLSATDGKLVRNLTRGYTNRYLEITTGAFEGKRDLTWSPDGDRVGYFVRKENRRQLRISDAVSGHHVTTIEVDVDNTQSPAFSPDGKSVLFSGNRAGIYDIFRMDLDSGGKKPGPIANLTDDNYYDSNPVWSPDGKFILYNRRIGGFSKVFLLDASDPSRKTQLTFGPSTDLTPSFGRGDKGSKTIYFVSDRGPLGIFNVWSLNTETGELNRWTDLVGGAFDPVQLGSEESKTTVAYVGFFRGTFRLYKTDLKTPVETISADAAPESADVQPFKPPLALKSDPSEKYPYKIRWSVDAPSIEVGAANDGTIFSNVNVAFTDLLGDHRINLLAASVAQYSNFDLSYFNLKHRLQWGADVLDFRDYYLTQSGNSFNVRRQSRYTGASALAAYPFNRYYRVEGQAGYLQRRLEFPVFNPRTGNLEFQNLSDDYGIFGVNFSGDTTRYREFGPAYGKRIDLGVRRGQELSGDTGSFTEYNLDFRGYANVTRRSLFAWRVASSISTGPGRTIYALGGYNELRGYKFREFIGNRIAYTNLEFRFPLIDELRFPFGAFYDLRGTVFVDAGAAWFENGLFYDSKTGNLRFDPNTCVAAQGQSGCDLNKLQFVKFKAYDNGRLQDARASWGVGFHFHFGGLQWHFDYAHQFPYDTFKQVKGKFEKVEVRNGAPRTNFWIGYQF